ncbi:MAG: GtrA family protein [Candidatus Accumulibacter sp.]|jgi:putative flippase GtrA|nr:GtrA family protein [Accumulibacter sp.]
MMSALRWATIKRMTRFICVGLLVSAIDVGVTWALSALGARYLAVSAGFAAGLLASYLLHALVTFSTPLEPVQQIPKFIVLVCVNYLETIGIVYMMINWAGFSVMTGKIVSLPMVALTSYVFSAKWVFKSSESSVS